MLSWEVLSGLTTNTTCSLAGGGATVGSEDMDNIMGWIQDLRCKGEGYTPSTQGLWGSAVSRTGAPPERFGAPPVRFGAPHVRLGAPPVKFGAPHVRLGALS